MNLVIVSINSGLPKQNGIFFVFQKTLILLPTQKDKNHDKNSGSKGFSISKAWRYPKPFTSSIEM